MKTCYCHTCDKRFHYLGINSHRAAHRRRGEKCTITYTYGNTLTFDWQPNKACSGLAVRVGNPEGSLTVEVVPDDGHGNPATTRW